MYYTLDLFRNDDAIAYEWYNLPITTKPTRTMSFPVNQVLQNRYGDEYKFVRLCDDMYRIDGKLTHWRVGLSETADEIEYVDPSGGPFIKLGMKIGDQPVTKIVHQQQDNNVVTFVFSTRTT